MPSLYCAERCLVAVVDRDARNVLAFLISHFRQRALFHRGVSTDVQILRLSPSATLYDRRPRRRHGCRSACSGTQRDRPNIDEENLSWAEKRKEKNWRAWAPILAISTRQTSGENTIRSKGWS